MAGVLPGFWGVRAGVSGVCCFLVAANVRGERLAGSGTGRSPAASGGAGGVLDAAGREPDDGAAGNGSRGVCGGYLVVRSGPSRGQGLAGGSAAGCIHPFACRGRGRGRMGRSASEKRSGGASQTVPAPPGRRGRKPGDLAPGRWPGKLFMPHMPAAAGSPAARRRRAWPGSGSHHHASRNRPG